LPVRRDASGYSGIVLHRLRRSPTSVRKSAFGTFSDSFSLKGEAFGAKSQFYKKEAGRIRDKASPRGEKLSAPRLFGAGGLTDVGWCSAQRIYNPMIAGGNHTFTIPPQAVQY
jgi:hypothetical protein